MGWTLTEWSPSLGSTLGSLLPRFITFNGHNRCLRRHYLLPTVTMHTRPQRTELRCPLSHVPPLEVPQQSLKKPSSPHPKRNQTERQRRRELYRRSRSPGQKRGTKVMARWIATSDSHQRLNLHLSRPFRNHPRRLPRLHHPLPLTWPHVRPPSRRTSNTEPQ